MDEFSPLQQCKRELPWRGVAEMSEVNIFCLFVLVQSEAS